MIRPVFGVETQDFDPKPPQKSLHQVGENRMVEVFSAQGCVAIRRLHLAHEHCRVAEIMYCAERGAN